jgi:hypothetical protein
MDNSKQIDPKWIELAELYKPSLLSRAKDWVEDKSPFLRHRMYWCERQDWLHPSRIYWKIKNVVRWTPILWNDVDWDYTSLYIVTLNKIKNMREHHEEHHNHTDWEEVVSQMKTAEGCLERLIEDNYLSEEWDKHRDKYPRIPHSLWEKLPDGCIKMPDMKEKERVEFLKLVDAEEKLRQTDKETFASAWTKHVQQWWD